MWFNDIVSVWTESMLSLLFVKRLRFSLMQRARWHYRKRKSFSFAFVSLINSEIGFSHYHLPQQQGNRSIRDSPSSVSSAVSTQTFRFILRKEGNSIRKCGIRRLHCNRKGMNTISESVAVMRLELLNLGGETVGREVYLPGINCLRVCM